MLAHLKSSQNVVRTQSGCSQIVVRMQSECSQSVVGMHSECRQNVGRMQAECSQIVARMQPEVWVLGQFGHPKKHVNFDLCNRLRKWTMGILCIDRVNLTHLVFQDKGNFVLSNSSVPYIDWSFRHSGSLSSQSRGVVGHFQSKKYCRFSTSIMIS